MSFANRFERRAHPKRRPFPPGMSIQPVHRGGGAVVGGVSHAVPAAGSMSIYMGAEMDGTFSRLEAGAVKSVSFQPPS